MSSAFTEPVVSPARLGRIYAFYAVGFAFFVLVLGLLEDQGITRQAIGYLFLGSTLLLYAYVGVINRTNDPAEYYVAGRRVPVAGRVSMDLTCLDVTDLEPGAVGAGDWATLIGGEVPLDEVAVLAATNAYELLTRLGPRLERRFLNGDLSEGVTR